MFLVCHKPRNSPIDISTFSNIQQNARFCFGYIHTFGCTSKDNVGKRELFKFDYSKMDDAVYTSGLYMYMDTRVQSGVRKPESWLRNSVKREL